MSYSGYGMKKERTLGVYLAAALAFVFVFGLIEPDDPLSARVAAALAALATSVAVVLFGYSVLLLKGGSRRGASEPLRERHLLEQEKTRLLSAIKEIDFDYAMEKINDVDHRELRSKYEERALRIILTIEQERGLWRDRAQALFLEHLEHAAEPAKAHVEEHQTEEDGPFRDSLPKRKEETEATPDATITGSCEIDDDREKTG